MAHQPKNMKKAHKLSDRVVHDHWQLAILLAAAVIAGITVLSRISA